jgi:thiamine biosynthesis protein ThiS
LEIHVQLFSILRDKLPPEKKGRTTIQLTDGATLADLLQEIDINRRVAISVNGVQESDHTRQLTDKDLVKVFTSVGGG